MVPFISPDVPVIPEAAVVVTVGGVSGERTFTVKSLQLPYSPVNEHGSDG